MSAHITCDRRFFGFDLYEWLMLLISVATVLAVYAILRDPVSASRTFADNIYDDACANIFLDNAWCTKFLIKGSLSSESSTQVNH
jgi:hypothetical protein